MSALVQGQRRPPPTPTVGQTCSPPFAAPSLAPSTAERLCWLVSAQARRQGTHTISRQRTGAAHAQAPHPLEPASDNSHHPCSGGAQPNQSWLHPLFRCDLHKLPPLDLPRLGADRGPLFKDAHAAICSDRATSETAQISRSVHHGSRGSASEERPGRHVDSISTVQQQRLRRSPVPVLVSLVVSSRKQQQQQPGGCVHHIGQPT